MILIPTFCYHFHQLLIIQTTSKKLNNLFQHLIEYFSQKCWIFWSNMVKNWKIGRVRPLCTLTNSSTPYIRCRKVRPSLQKLRRNVPLHYITKTYTVCTYTLRIALTENFVKLNPGTSFSFDLMENFVKLNTVHTYNLICIWCYGKIRVIVK